MYINTNADTRPNSPYGTLVNWSNIRPNTLLNEYKAINKNVKRSNDFTTTIGKPNQWITKSGGTRDYQNATHHVNTDSAKIWVDNCCSYFMSHDSNDFHGT